MRLIGAFAIMAASMLLGIGAVRSLREGVHRAETEVFRLARLRSLVLGARSPLDEALGECGIELEEADKPFAERWRAWAKSPALSELGDYLAGVDEEAKRAAFERAFEEAEKVLSEARARCERDTRLSLALSATLGAATVILLI